MAAMIDRRHDRRLEHGRRCWDLMSGQHERADHSDAMLDLALPELDVRAGHTVLEIGCGPGNTLGRLRAAVAPGGRVIGVDYSPKMLARAARRRAEHGWDDVELRRMDFTRPDGTTQPSEHAGDGASSSGGIEPESVDRAIAVASISAMPDVAAALANAYTALRPGGRLFVFDMRLRPIGRAAPVIRLCSALYRLTAAYTGVDVLDTARSVFDEIRFPDVPPRAGAAPRPQTDRAWPPLTVFVAHKNG